ncbi:putative GTPase activating protein [Leptomonas pyrrhocoris]|uniref:Putative GTPase activating protein n=1 Tax=Leptomonas pyrrhocoris TaxID=157538 RepID=A0A0N0DWI1_LEPPY|nr:putative GTPase activating protein [Leptomonas pyrrhocoris]XP_015660252.1 putative GTPase activating protein [Leptomonas pyrrhocoris]KPA81812.1 putative GTPase activating protein [Leptomonas pyrrhocoris]KPA81813.1 putative GTPase activating protein [Leptomonas pyrrhocoris]|eukprot:XP_015660251.1 putative GTPase activating protein [Leptomonas pyrrhocoris]
MANTAAHLQEITGLAAARAKECFDVFGNYPTALASFAQSYAAIPADYFEDAQVARTNARKINDELRAIYRKARELKSASGKPDAEVWKAYPVEGEEKPAAASSAPAAPAAFPAKAADERPLLNFGGAAAPAASATNKLGFGVGSAAPQSSILGAAPGTQEPPKFGFGAAQSSVLGAAPGANSIFAAPAPASGSPNSAATFGFGAALGSPSATAAPAFGFGKAADAPAAAAAEAKGEAAAAEAETPAAEVKKKPVKYCDPKHFTGPYFDMPRFWEAEVVGRAPLLNLNNGFLEAHKDELRQRLAKWVAKAAFYRKPVKYVEIEDEDEEVVRVIIKDADRTFFDPEHRAKMVAFLNAMFHEFNAYGQAMSYLAGLCMLVLTEDETAAVIRFVATEYIKGHWAAEAVGFATSAWVVEHFMQKLQPEVAKHLEALNFWPDTYLQKILTGLCIHVLQFNELFQFLDAFMAGGMHYLIRFCLAIVEHFRTNLLAIKDSTEANELYELLRLDSRVADREDVLTILARAPSIDLGEDGSSIDVIRSEVYTKRIEPRLKRAPKTETFEPCVVCGKNRPNWWNDARGAVCDSCKDAAPDLAYEKF